MKLSVSSAASIRRKAAEIVNRHFSAEAHANSHRDAAQARKRELAAAGRTTLELEAEAALRGLSIEQMHELILSRPADIDARELRRQRIMLAIEAAITAGEVRDVLASESIAWPDHAMDMAQQPQGV